MTVSRPGVFAHTQKQWRRKSFFIFRNWNKNLNRLFKESFSLQLCLFYTLTIKKNKMSNWKLTNDESLYFCWSLYNLCFIWFIIKAISPTSIRKSAVILVHSVQYYVLHLLYYVYFYRSWTQWHSTTRLCWTWTRSRRRASRSWPSSCSSPPSPPSPLETCCCSTANTRYAAVFYLKETNYSSKDSHWPAKRQVKDAFLDFLSCISCSSGGCSY